MMVFIKFQVLNKRPATHSPIEGKIIKMSILISPLMYCSIDLNVKPRHISNTQGGVLKPGGRFHDGSHDEY